MAKVSVVTATFQSRSFASCRDSVCSQSIPVEHVVIDGDSGPLWTQEHRKRLSSTDQFVSEPDNGIYDAINKGIRRAHSEIVGLLHSDDVFADSSVIQQVAEYFDNTDADVVYGDLHYVTMGGKIIRRWCAGEYQSRKLLLGWMPPHPTLFIRRELFDSVGLYDTSYHIAGDYEFILRLFKDPGLRVHYLPITITRMTLGGASNRDIQSILVKMKEDVRAMRTHGINPWIALPAKNLRKLVQFLPLFN